VPSPQESERQHEHRSDTYIVGYTKTGAASLDYHGVDFLHADRFFQFILLILRASYAILLQKERFPDFSGRFAKK
jgi:hypothetical protein